MLGRSSRRCSSCRRLLRWRFIIPARLRYAQRVRADEAPSLPRSSCSRRSAPLAGACRSVVARPDRRRARDPRGALSLAPASRHICTIFWLVVPRTQAVVDQRDPPACERLPSPGSASRARRSSRICWRRLDERPADVVVPHQPQLEREIFEAAAYPSPAKVPESGHRDDEIHVGGLLLRTARAPRRLRTRLHRLAEDRAVGTGEVDVLEGARRRLETGDERLFEWTPRHVDDDLAPLDVADALGAQEVERAGSRSQTRPGAVHRGRATAVGTPSGPRGREPSRGRGRVSEKAPRT